MPDGLARMSDQKLSYTIFFQIGWDGMDGNLWRHLFYEHLSAVLINKDHNHYWNSLFVNHSGNPRFVWNTLSLTNGGPSFCLLSCEFSSFLPILRTLVSDVGSPQQVENGTFQQLVLCSVSSIGRLGFSTHNPSNKHPMAAAASKGFFLTLAQRGNYWPLQAFAPPPQTFLETICCYPAIPTTTRLVVTRYFLRTSEFSFLQLNH